MNIKLRAKNLVKKYQTRNPFDLAGYLGIEVVFTPMRRTHGFCDRILRRRFIVINSNLSYHEQKEACAHEIGHILLHKGLSYYFLLEYTLCEVGKFERQANEFAWYTLFDENECKEDYDGNVIKFAKSNGIYDLYKAPKTTDLKFF